MPLSRCPLSCGVTSNKLAMILELTAVFLLLLFGQCQHTLIPFLTSSLCPFLFLNINKLCLIMHTFFNWFVCYISSQNGEFTALWCNIKLHCEYLLLPSDEFSSRSSAFRARVLTQLSISEKPSKHPGPYTLSDTCTQAAAQGFYDGIHTLLMSLFAPLTALCLHWLTCKRVLN